MEAEEEPASDDEEEQEMNTGSEHSGEEEEEEEYETVRLFASQQVEFLKLETVKNSSIHRVNPFPHTTILQQTTEHILSKNGKSL